jgi:hypothetical protein
MSGQVSETRAAIHCQRGRLPRAYRTLTYNYWPGGGPGPCDRGSSGGARRVPQAQLFTVTNHSHSTVAAPSET